MKYFFDTEFIEDGKTIDLVSIGIVCSDGRVFYAESVEADHSKASDWVKRNVLSQLKGSPAVRMNRSEIRASILLFTQKDPKPIFWAYYADYDWVALCQLFGTMMDLPKGWPFYCRDLKQLADQIGAPKFPGPKGEHNALDDARWNAEFYDYLVQSESGINGSLKPKLHQP